MGLSPSSQVHATKHQADQNILLPSLLAAATEDLHYVDEVAHTCRPEASLAGDGESRHRLHRESLMS